ncbi:MAG: pentapeptide repeat-containing protein [Trichocoleus desertorum ATA4-8-CV12]|jgi:uncharacterized protein YjbI with pentapeptide repeats|nr:pentapeptide repeat-containing protein [Trichocoleus desertorum ATA4-8-CV12]
MSQIQALHQEAMDLAESALTAKLRGDLAQSNQLLRQAFEKEAQAAALIANDLNAEPTRSVLHRSAAALAIDCGEFQVAERLIMTALTGEPPQAIAEELKNLFFQINQPQHFQSKENPWSEKEKYLSLLRQGVEVWNRWREENPNVNPDLGGVSFSGINLDGFDFHNTILWNSNFSGSSLREAILTRAFLQRAYLFGVDLTRADLRGAFLSEAILGPANLYEADLSGADLLQANLSDACLYGARLHTANLTKADLTKANFTKADLSESILLLARAVYTNFERAILTGVCIQDWSINESTNLSSVLCDYVYRRLGVADQLEERYPSSENFAPGEFTKRFQVAQNVIELAFRDGVPWKAFAYAFNESNIQVLDEYGGELFLQEYKVLGDGLVTLKVGYPPNADGVEIRTFLEQRTYELELKVATLEGEVKAKDFAFEKLVRVLEAPKVQVGHITTLNFQIGETNLMSGDRNIYTGGGSYYESINTGGGDYIQGDYVNMSQDLTQVEAQIQDLVEQRQKSGVTVDVAKQQVADDLATQAKSNPTIREKLTKWVQEAAGKAVVAEVVKEVLKGAAASVGIHLP